MKGRPHSIQLPCPIVACPAGDLFVGLRVRDNIKWRVEEGWVLVLLNGPV